jgi:sec-independent protein translocase protein TatA
MAIQGIEWVVVAVIIAILFLWGPEKLPKMARAVGQARREFEKASKGLEEEISKAASLTPTTTPPDDKLIEVARALNIETEGKTREQIAQEIIAKSKTSS